MSKGYVNLFVKDIEVPKKVSRKAEETLEEIIHTAGMENKETKHRKSGDEEAKHRRLMNEKTEPGRTRKIPQTFVKAAAIIGAIILGGGSITALAAVYFHVTKGLESELHMDESQKIKLQEEGIMTQLQDPQMDVENRQQSEEGNGQQTGQQEMSNGEKGILVSPAQTDAGITVTAMQTIADSYYVYVSFKVEGYDLPEGCEPCFEFVDVYMREDVNDGEKDDEMEEKYDDEGKVSDDWINMCGSFYNGIRSGSDGKNNYDDGSELQFTENGRLIEHFLQEDGSLEYIVQMSAPDRNETLIGKKVHVDFTNLGTVYKADYKEDIQGNWNFELDIRGSEKVKKYELNEEIGDSGIKVISAEISPISILVDYDFPRSEMEKKKKKGEKLISPVPEICGVYLKDGTLLGSIMNGGNSGYESEDSDVYQIRIATDHVLDTDQIAGLLFWNMNTEVGEEGYTEDNYYKIEL